MDDADAVRRSSGCAPEVTLDGGRAHVQGLGDLSNGETLASKFTKTIHVEPNARASDSRTTAACLRHAGFRSLDQTSAFLLSEPITQALERLELVPERATLDRGLAKDGGEDVF
jgi:hypothetical protein